MNTFDSPIPVIQSDWCRNAEKIRRENWRAYEPVARGIDAFGIDLYGHLRQETAGNLFVSPLSISSALAMTYLGAQGETAEQMARVLHLPADRQALENGYLNVLSQIGCPGTESASLTWVANALWMQKGFVFLPDYLASIKRSFNGNLEPVDFQKATEAARQRINQWTAEQTRDKIQELIQHGILTDSTRLVLTNAVYFRGGWEKVFPKAATQSKPFFADGKREIKVPMMHVLGGESSTHFLAEKDFTALKLFFKNQDQSLIVFLPRERNGLAKLESELTAAKLQKWIPAFHPAKVEVTFPKFKMNGAFQLGKTLTSMGMKRAFDGQHAQFAGIDGGKNLLYIGNVIHKTYLDVNEEGAEAAAATAVVMRAGGMPQEPKEKPVFNADHPFFFLLHDNRSETVLFMGRVIDPSDQG